MDYKKSKFKLIDYIFWVLFIIYSNPGGMLQALGLVTAEGSISVKDFLFFSLFGCYLLVFQKRIYLNSTYHKTIKYLVIFGLYYFIVFGYITPVFKETSGYSFFSFIKKNRRTVYSWLLFIMVYNFYLRSYVLFFKTLILSSILILTLFLISFFTGINIIPYEEINRGFINVNRIFLISYGYFFLLIPMGFIVIVYLKHGFKWKKYILAAFFLMIITVLLTITRRHLIGILIYFFIAFMLNNYFQHKSIISVKKLVSISFYILIFGFILSLSFPKYLEAGKAGFEESANVIVKGETSTGKKDVRMGFGKDFMKNLIIDNYLLGTGFDNRWRTKEGDNQGYEASDYPMLGAIAMTGIIGVLLFLPIYVLLVKSLIYDIKFFRKYKVDYHSLDFFAMLIFIIYFTFHILQYMNWFMPVSLSGRSDWYIYLAMYFASRQTYYSSNSVKRTSIENKIKTIRFES